MLNSLFRQRQDLKILEIREKSTSSINSGSHPGRSEPWEVRTLELTPWGKNITAYKGGGGCPSQRLMSPGFQLSFRQGVNASHEERGDRGMT